MVNLPIYKGILDKKDYIVKIYHNQNVMIPDLSEVVFLGGFDLERILKEVEGKYGQRIVSIYP